MNAKIKNLTSDVGSSKEIDESYFTAEMDEVRTSWDSIITFTATTLSKTPVELSKERWEFKNEKWYYKKSDGTYAKKVQTISGRTYYFNEDGSLMLRKGLQEIDGKKYYFNEDGSLFLGWKDMEGKRYYFEQGQMVVGWKRIDVQASWHAVSVQFYFNDDGSLATGWKKFGGDAWYYFRPTSPNGDTFRGEMVYSNRQDQQETIDGVRYHFSPDGKLLEPKEPKIIVGWKQIDGKWYYFNEDGSQVKESLKQIGGKWYYLKKDGALYTKGTLKFVDKNDSIEGSLEFDGSGALIETRGLPGGISSWNADKITIEE
ncbi:N-acetylmuramoyl-L-alanine amidase family protein [Bacillus mycoides]|uniref:N-acetylmuramoyl-L-alanine amidase family protein n=1 Tax=Bacillus mycoides TaxID=1405 RepID=UPI003D649D1A